MSCRVRVLPVGYWVSQKPQNYSVGYRRCHRTHRTITHCMRVLQNLTDKSGIVTDRHGTIL